MQVTEGYMVAAVADLWVCVEPLVCVLWLVAQPAWQRDAVRDPWRFCSFRGATAAPGAAFVTPLALQAPAPATATHLQVHHRGAARS